MFGSWRRALSVEVAAPPLSAANGDVTVPNNGPIALFLDVDGTLLDLADWPGAVVTPAGLVAALAKVERKLAGRPSADQRTDH